MNTRKLGLTLILGGIGLIVLAVIWFFAAYAGAFDMMSGLGGNDMAGRLMSCLYSSSALCQGAGFFSDAPSYSPVVLWIGVIALLAGVVLRFASARSGPADGSMAASADAQHLAGADALPQTSDKIMEFIPPQKFTRLAYILVLTGAIGGLLLTPLMIVALLGFVLALLGLSMFKPRLDPLDTNHLAAISVTFAASFVLLLMARGSMLFLLIALAQVILYYIGFNSFRHGRSISGATLKEEARFAAAPIMQRGSSTSAKPENETQDRQE